MAAADRPPLARHLDHVARKALAKLEEIINAPNGPGYADHGPLARIQADAAKTILGALMRADEAKLRDRREAASVRQLLEAVLGRKAGLAALEEPDDE